MPRVSDHVDGPQLEPWVPHALELLRAMPQVCRGRRTIDITPIPQDVETDLKTRHIDSLYYIASAAESPAQRLYRKIWEIQKSALKEFVGACNAVGLSPTIWKGTEIFESLLQSRPISYMADIDCIFRQEELAAVKHALYGIDYRQGRFDGDRWDFGELDIREVAKIEASHYELAPFCKMVPLQLEEDELAVAATITRRLIWIKNNYALFEVMFDIHHGLAADLSYDEGISETINSAFPGAQTFTPTDHLWILTAKYYAEVALHGKRTVRDMAYITALLSGSEIDWDRVAFVADHYELRPSLYYFLCFIDSLIGPNIPADVLKCLSPSNGKRMRDWGWQLGPLFDFVERAPLDSSFLRNPFSTGLTGS